MKKLFLILFYLFFFFNCCAQNNIFDELGHRIFYFEVDKQIVTVLMKSKKGEETIKKPLILYIQGSMGRPLIINYPENKNFKYSIAFPFEIDNLIDKYHIAVISKPFIPYIANIGDSEK